VFLIAVSRAVLGQHPDTVPATHGSVLPLAIRDTSDRLFGSQQTPRSLGASVGVIDSAMIASSHARTLSELLEARVPGVSVMRSSGIVGGGSRVRLRGATGLYATREPIVILDGVRVDASQNGLGLSIGGQQPSRLDDIDVDQIARIEVLRGPAASALYGTNGAGGVIRITTRAPSRNHQLAWSTYGEGGLSTDITGYPANYSTGSGITGEPTCTRADASLDTCTPGPLLSWNPLENASPFRTATSGRLGASVSGGLGGIGYVAGGAIGHEQGVLEPNDATRYALRLNASAQPIRSLDLALHTSYTHSSTTLPLGDALQSGKLYAGLLGNAVDDPVNRGYRSDGLTALSNVPTDQRVGRATASFAATWKPLGWLTARALAGGEALNRDDARDAEIPLGGTPPTTARLVEGSTGRDRSATLDANATASFDLAQTLKTETTLGIEWLGASLRSTDSSRGSLSASHTKPRVTGLIASERLAWHDRRFIGVGVRQDQTTIPYVAKFVPATFVSADAAWVIGDESFFPRVDWLSQLRLRGSWGRSADYRSYFSPPSSFVPFSGDVSPERIAEAEVGLDAMLFRHVWLDATWYRQSSDNALTCCFYSAAVTNGAWHTTGLDAALAADIIKSFHVQWSARLTMSFLTNRLDDDGEGNRNRPVGPRPVLPRVTFRNVVGYPLAGIWGNPTRTHDDNGDGIITPAEVDVLPDSVYLGSSTPTREIGLTSTVKYRRLTVAALLDYRGGFSQLNATAALRCDLGIWTCGALYDPKADFDEQTRAISLDRAGAGFVEDASFLRLRELGVTWQLVPGWAARHGFARVSTTLIARNLLTFTGYSGFDPETNFLGQSGLGTGDLFTLPLPRSIALRFDLVR
jgi:TonB-dependent SusC/RagA subfamily outer membrane receptor